MFVPNRILLPSVLIIGIATSIVIGVILPPSPGDLQAVAAYTRMLNSPERLRYLVSGSQFTVAAQAAILVDVQTRTVLYSKAAKVKRSPASTTKILTALVAIERGDLNSVVTVSDSSSKTRGSSAKLRKGEELTLRDAIKVMLLCSGNDAALAVAQHIAGDGAAFAEMMNRCAREVGATSSNFLNPHGLDRPGHYSTAEDLALISLKAVDIPVFTQLVRTRTAEIKGTKGNWPREYSNTNKLLWTFDGAEGIKTGTTGNAGQCLVALASRNGRQLISVVLGSTNRYRDTELLFEHGFSGFELITGTEKGEAVGSVRVEDGMKDQATLVGIQTAQFIVEKDDMSRLNICMNLPSPLYAPLHEGQVVGSWTATIGDMEVASAPIAVADAIKRRTWWRVLFTWIEEWYTDFVSLFLSNFRH